MKILIATLILAAAAAASYAADFGWLFRGDGRRVALSELVASAPAPAVQEGEKPGNCTFPVNIKPDEAHYFLEVKKPIVIDIRTKEEYDAGHLEAVNMLMDYYAPDFKEQLAKLDKDAKYFIYCRTGHRTGITLGIMHNMGFTDIHDLDGGINAWIAAGWPVVK